MVDKATEEDNCQLEMAARNDDIQKKWLLIKETWLKASKQVCGMGKGGRQTKGMSQSLA